MQLWEARPRTKHLSKGSWQWVDVCLPQDGVNAEIKQICSLFSLHFCFLLQTFPWLKVGCSLVGLEDLLCKKLSFPAVTEFMSIEENPGIHTRQYSLLCLYKMHLKVPKKMLEMCLLPSTRWHFKMFTTHKPLINRHLGKKNPKHSNLFSLRVLLTHQMPYSTMNWLPALLSRMSVFGKLL